MIFNWHEAGHAIVQIERFPDEPIDFLSIEPHYGVQGFMSVCTDESPHCSTKQEIRYRIQVALAGREAECLSPYGSDLNTGAHDDLRKANEWARDAVLTHGMDEKYGSIVYALSPEETYKHLPRYEQECVHAWIKQERVEVRALLKSKLAALKAVSNALMSNKSLNHDQIVELINLEKYHDFNNKE